MQEDLKVVFSLDGIKSWQFAERSFSDQVKRCKEAQWLSENQDGIAQYNAEVDKNGMFGDGWRGQL